VPEPAQDAAVTGGDGSPADEAPVVEDMEAADGPAVTAAGSSAPT